MITGARGIDRSWWVKFGLLSAATVAIVGALAGEDDPAATADVVISTVVPDAPADLPSSVPASMASEFAAAAAPVEQTTTTTTASTTTTTAAPSTTVSPTTTEAALPQAVAAANCDPSYPDVCIPPFPPDLDCGEITHRRFRVIGSDLHGFDRDGDGIGCERD